jgi:hypothetical protein
LVILDNSQLGNTPDVATFRNFIFLEIVSNHTVTSGFMYIPDAFTSPIFTPGFEKGSDCCVFCLSWSLPEWQLL